MYIAFFDPSDIDYNADTPLTKPLGGTQSALCYLAAALSRLGHQVTMVNRTASPGRYNGVQSFGLTDEGLRCLQISEVVVVQSSAMALKLRQDLHVKGPIVLWAHHACDQPAVQPLQDPRELNAWSGFVFGSEWNLDQHVWQFGVRPDRARVFHNGISPPFALQAAAPPWFERGAAPVLAYTSTPFRGLSVLLDAFPAIRAAIPETQLHVYSGMSVYGAEDSEYRLLYERCRNTPGVAYIGPVAQTRLVHDLDGIAALAYPSTFPETFCIAAAEAMATGALLLTTHLGALPELYGDFAQMIELDTDPRKLADAYSGLVIAALDAVRRDPAGAADRRKRQIDFIKAKYAWPVIAAQWVPWLQDVAGRAQGHAPRF